ncbi:SPFH domain-containing protein [Methylobacterium organophilum]|uniref:SPFH domain-containing protein n=1 Tax=Methylobacterium organophilum TaxID=410 RepID=UPI001F147777|nr:SPFH domain-containing protein [Methylobacterium organophilum]UMY18302.1 SPFH domain-containing protein [Methylobacterium organophilum]
MTGPATAPHATQDVPYRALNGWWALLLSLPCLAFGALFFLGGLGTLLGRGSSGVAFLGVAVLAGLTGLVLLAGLITLKPRQAAVLTLFGRYHGTIARDGFWWRNPLTAVAKVSLATEAQETKIITVNDLMGNPITIAAAAIWRVQDAARATFDVGSYRDFVSLQAEAALRNIASTRPYDHEEAENLGQEAGDAKRRLAEKATRVASLRADRDAIHADLIGELGQRVGVAGVIVEDVRLTHLAYAPEIAGAMLKRQQAGAIIAARRQIVEGAVGIVRDTIARLEQPEDGRPGIPFDEQGRASMAQTMLIMIVGDREATPVVSVGKG